MPAAAFPWRNCFTSAPARQRCYPLAPRDLPPLPCTAPDPMRLAVFDLDNTLLAGDSDHLWGEFLVREGLVDGEAYARENDRYYEAYKAGTLDIAAYCAFALAPIVEHGVEKMTRLRSEEHT